MKEHYGVEAPISAVRVITQKHGAALVAARDLALESKLPKRGVTTVVGEMDGSMVPIVTIRMFTAAVIFAQGCQVLRRRIKISR